MLDICTCGTVLHPAGWLFKPTGVAAFGRMARRPAVSRLIVRRTERPDNSGLTLGEFVCSGGLPFRMRRCMVNVWRG